MARCSGHLFLCGNTQVGKTTMTRERILPRAPRWLALDREGAYGDPADLQTRDPREAADHLEAHLEGSLALSFGHHDERAHRALVAYLYRLAELRDLPPTLLLLDEAHAWTIRPRGGDPLARIYTTGLQHGLMGLTVTQFPQYFPKKLRNLHAFRVLMRVPPESLTGDFEKSFEGRLERAADLEKVTPGTRPEDGQHYLTSPADLDLFAWLERELSG